MSLERHPYDTARRFAAILWAARQFEFGSSPRFLDVGGYPGLLAELLREQYPESEALTVDTVDEEREHYRKADGARLPFQDNEFDAVFSSDVLEHVPGRDRPAFISEMLRVSNGPVILGAPFFNEATSFIEKQIDDTHRELTGQPHPWLFEHVENGLPDLTRTLECLNGRTNALIRSAPLQNKTFCQWAALMEDIDGVLTETLKQSTGSLSQKVVDEDFQHVAPGHENGFLPYRWVIVSQTPDNAPLLAPDVEALRPQPGEVARAIATSDMLRALALAIAKQSDSRDIAGSIDTKLSAALELAEKENRKLREQTQRSRGGLARLLNRTSRS